MRLERDASMMDFDPPDFICNTGLPKSQATAPKESEATASVLFPGLLSDQTNITQLAQNLIDENGIRDFLNRSQDICEFWTSLLRNTSLPDGITHQDAQVTNVFKYVEDMITSDTMERQLVRLVWIRLTNILDRFDEVIKSDRRTRRLGENQGKRNASIAIKIHQESISAAQRSDIKWRRRIARRWTLLTNGSLFLAIVFSNRADTLVRDLYVSAETLKLLATEIVRISPLGLIQASAKLEELGSLAASGRNRADDFAGLFSQLEIGT